MRFFPLVVAFFLNLSASALPWDQYQVPFCGAFLTTENSQLWGFQSHLEKMLRDKLLSPEELALSKLVTARSAAGDTLFGVLVVENEFPQPESYFALKKGFFGRPLWRDLRYEKPGDYFLSDGRVVHVSRGIRQSRSRTSKTYDISVK